MGFWDGSGISWTICKQPAPSSRQITTRTPHHSFFYRPDALPDAQLTLSEHRRHSIVEPSKWRTLIRILCSNHKDRYLLNKLSVWSEVQTCIWPSWCHCHSLSLAPVKSRLVLPSWYRLTQVVLEKRPLNGCSCCWISVFAGTG